MKKVFLTAVIGSAFIVSCSKTNAVTGPKYSSSTKISEGKAIYDNSCNKCHNLPDPTKHTDEQWVKILSVMAPKAKLTAEQHQLVYDYLANANNQ